jgi:branched-subunit amino acid aminotransferase/4-amino-4-deoxychorismate lyase
LAREELGIETDERPIARAELYTAEECFMTGTAAHVTAVVDIDRRPVGNGKTGGNGPHGCTWTSSAAKNSKYGWFCSA